MIEMEEWVMNRPKRIAPIILGAMFSLEGIVMILCGLIPDESNHIYTECVDSMGTIMPSWDMIILGTPFLLAGLAVFIFGIYNIAWAAKNDAGLSHSS